MTDIVKYQNELNTNTEQYPVFKLTEVQQNVFMVILSHTTFNDTQWIELNIQTLKEKSNYWRDSLSDFTTEINSLLDKICSPKLKIETDKSIHIFSCFDELHFNKETLDLRLHIQDSFYHMVKNYKLGFTRFELAEFVSLSGSYAKTLYRQLKQFKSQGWWYIEIEEFRKLLNIPESYRQRDIDKQILLPSIAQLSRKSDLIDEATGSKRIPFKKLTVEKIKKKGRGRGGVVSALRFSFEPQKDLIPENIPDRQPQSAAEPQAPQAPQANFNLGTDHLEPAPDFSEFAQEKSTYTVDELKQMPAGEFAAYYINAMKDSKTDKSALAYALGSRPDSGEIMQILNQYARQKKTEQFQNEFSQIK